MSVSMIQHPVSLTLLIPLPVSMIQHPVSLTLLIPLPESIIDTGNGINKVKLKVQ
jgi:hypothetical protein